jgi:hypothetical protein
MSLAVFVMFMATAILAYIFAIVIVTTFERRKLDWEASIQKFPANLVSRSMDWARGNYTGDNCYGENGRS